MLATHTLLFSDSEVKFHFLRHALRNQLDDNQKCILFSECCLSVVCSGDGYVHKTECGFIWRPKEGVGLRELESEVFVNHPTWMLESSSGPVQEQCAFLTTSMSGLQSSKVHGGKFFEMANCLPKGFLRAPSLPTSLFCSCVVCYSFPVSNASHKDMDH